MTDDSATIVRFFSGVRANVLANFVGRFSSMGLAIVCTPLYIHFLGIEAYGLIGFYITLQASLAVLEMGLKPTCVKELAHHSARGEAGISVMRDTLRSLEMVYWCVALLIGMGLSVGSTWVAGEWLNNTSFSTDRLEHVLLLIAWVIALRWPMGLYNGALMGLQRQILLNAVLVGLSVLNWGGSVLVLWLIQPDIEHFFQWQLLVSIMTTAIFGLVAWFSMPKSGMAGRFSMNRIKAIVPFAIGTGSNAILGTILLQADKIILSAILPLKQFGYYMLASVMASAIAMIADPVSNAVFPRLSQMIGKKVAISSIEKFYHLACQSVSAIVIPFSLLVAVFPGEVLYAYTGQVDVAHHAAMVLPVLVIAKMLHASMMIPYALQLAYSYVRLSVYINVVSVIWILPAVYLMADAYGAVGASLAWLTVTIGYVFIGLPLMHKIILPKQWGRWFRSNIVVPVTVILFFLLLCKISISEPPSGRWEVGGLIAAIGTVSFIMALFLLPLIRERVMGILATGRAA